MSAVIAQGVYAIAPKGNASAANAVVYGEGAIQLAKLAWAQQADGV